MKSHLAAIVFALLLPGVARGQVEQGAITGRVSDQLGAAVPGASVTVKRIETGVTIETVTSDTGQYAVPYLPVGTYEVTATLAGFTTARVTGVAVRVGLTATVDLSLTAGAIQDEVTVTAHAAHLELASAALGNIVSGRQMQQLPIVGRNPYALVTLAPGVVDRGNTGTGPLINGARSNSTAVMLDGAEQRNSTTNDLNYSPPLESVEEFKVTTNGLSAEFGRTGGGVITVATRSGTNTLHGSAYVYVRNDRFNANSWTNNRNNVAKGKEDIKQYGFTAGGPIWRNHTFFFVNVERSTSETPDNLIRTVPTLRQRAGDFSETRTSTGQLITIYDPLTTRPNPAGGFMRDPFPGNVIPADRIDPIARAILQHYPLPTNDNATQNFINPRTRESASTPLVFRVDHTMGRHRLFASFRQSNSKDNSPTVSVAFPDPGTNGEAGTRANDGLSSIVSDTIMFRPNLIAEVRFGYTRSHFTTAPATLGLDFETLGIGSRGSRAQSTLGDRDVPEDRGGRRHRSTRHEPRRPDRRSGRDPRAAGARHLDDRLARDQRRRAVGAHGVRRVPAGIPVGPIHVRLRRSRKGRIQPRRRRPRASDWRRSSSERRRADRLRAIRASTRRRSTSRRTCRTTGS